MGSGRCSIGSVWREQAGHRGARLVGGRPRARVRLPRRLDGRFGDRGGQTGRSTARRRPGWSGVLGFGATLEQAATDESDAGNEGHQ